MAAVIKNAHILIVDDDRSVRETMHEYIRNAGFNSQTAATAEEALDLIKKNNFHVVITDIILPGLGGLELTKTIKKNNGSDVIVVTGYSDDYSYEEAINIGASDFVIKPVRLEELLLRLKRVLKERQLTEERVRMMEKLQKLAITDGLTKLYNSRSFYSQVSPNSIIPDHFTPSWNWRLIASTATAIPFLCFFWILIISKTTTIVGAISKATRFW
jgi:PleD family two-component response regulator